MRKDKTLIICIKIIVWSMPVLLIAWLVQKNFVINGIYAVTYEPMKESKVVKNFASKETDVIIGQSKQSKANEYYRLITTSPVYFDVVAPRLFPEATLKLYYENPDQQPEIDLGVLQANGTYYYKTLASYNKCIEDILDGLYSDWSVVQEKDNILLQRGEKKYQSLEDFLKNKPEISKVLQFEYPISYNLDLPGYSINAPSVDINRSLRGKHELYTYVDESGVFYLEVQVQDINRNFGADPITVTLLDNNNIRYDQIEIDDDGVDIASGQTSRENKVIIDKNDLQQGVYKIIFDASDDIFIKSVHTRQKKLVFYGQLYLTDNEEYKDIIGNKSIQPTQVYTESNDITVKTAHENGYQDVDVNGSVVRVDKKHQYFTANDLPEFSTIHIPKNDILIEGEGFFAFSREQYFDPEYNIVPTIKKIYDEAALENYDYIIGKYHRAQKLGSKYIAQSEITIPYLYFQENRNNIASFIFSLPGLPENDRLLKIHKVEIIFEKDPVRIDNILDKIKNNL